MASALNAVYVAAVVAVALAGSVFVANVDTTHSSPRWLEWSSVLIVLLFVVLVGFQFAV